MIEIPNLHKSYQVGDIRQPALRGVDLSIGEGELAVLAGRSGSGKTTLSNIIGGLEDVDRRSVKIKGEDLSSKSQAQRTAFRLHHIGFVFQTYNLMRILTARESVAYVYQLQGRKRRGSRQMACRSRFGRIRG